VSLKFLLSTDLVKRKNNGPTDKKPASPRFNKNENRSSEKIKSKTDFPILSVSAKTNKAKSWFCILTPFFVRKKNVIKTRLLITPMVLNITKRLSIYPYRLFEY